MSGERRRKFAGRAEGATWKIHRGGRGSNAESLPGSEETRSIHRAFSINIKMKGDEQMTSSSSSSTVDAATTAAAAAAQQFSYQRREYPQPPGPPRRIWNDSPVVRMTVGLLDTYKRVNDAYYEAKKKTAAAQQGMAVPSIGIVTTSSTTSSTKYDTEDADYKIVPGDILADRYRVVRGIGKGSFGQVVIAEDLEDKREVAVKIIKARKQFTKQAQTEIRILEMLNRRDEQGTYCVVRMLRHFVFRNHQCIVFEKLDKNLYDLLRSSRFEGFSLDLIGKFARQILVALSFFAQPDVGIIHADLKPENILLIEPKHSALKVIDFGSSCTTGHRPFSYIQSRFYRSPEVMLGCQYSTPIDMWSLGCILIEMHSGEPLFSGQNEHEQMFLLVGSRGMPPEEMLAEGDKEKVSKFFEELPLHTSDMMSTSGSPPPFKRRWRLKDVALPSNGKQLKEPMSIERALGIAPNSSSTAPFIRKQKQQGRSGPARNNDPFYRYLEFADLLNRMLAYNPKERITPDEALKHDFLADRISPVHTKWIEMSKTMAQQPQAPATTFPQAVEVAGSIKVATIIGSAAATVTSSTTATASATAVSAGVTTKRSSQLNRQPKRPFSQ